MKLENWKEKYGEYWEACYVMSITRPTLWAKFRGWINAKKADGLPLNMEELFHRAKFEAKSPEHSAAIKRLQDWKDSGGKVVEPALP